MITSGVSNAIMDKLQFHFHKSVFSEFKNIQFWNPTESWKNKWKGGDKEKGEKFPLSSTILVFTTDAWHLFKFIRVNTLIIGSILIGLYVNGLDIKYMVLIIISLIIIHKIIFEYFFGKILNKKK